MQDSTCPVRYLWKLPHQSWRWIADIGVKGEEAATKKKLEILLVSIIGLCLALLCKNPSC